MVLEVTDISSGGEIATASPKQGHDVVVTETSTAAATNTSPVIESRDAPSVTSSSSSMRMYADELTDPERQNTEELLGFSPTNEHRDQPVCGAYFNSTPTTSVDVKRVSSIVVPVADERQADSAANEAVAIVADVAEMLEETKNDVSIEKKPVGDETIENEVVLEEKEEIITTDLVEEKLVEDETTKEMEGEVTEAPDGEDAQDAETVVTEPTPEPVFLESKPDSIEASFSKCDQLDEVEQIEAEPETVEVVTSLATSNGEKKKRVSFLLSKAGSKASLAASLASSRAKSVTNTLSSLSKPSVPKASLRKMAKLPKMEKVPSVKKLSSSVVAESRRRLSSLPKPQRSLPFSPKKLSKPSFGKKSKKTEQVSPQEDEDLESATPKDELSTSTSIVTENQTVCLPNKFELQEQVKGESESKVAEVDTPAVAEAHVTVSEAPISIAEEPSHRSYFDDLLDKIDLLCAPVCKKDFTNETLCAPASTFECAGENSQLMINTITTEPSIQDAPLSVCSVATEQDFGEDKQSVQETEPGKLDVAAMMAKKALDKGTDTAEGKSKFSFRRSNLKKEKSMKSSLKIFSPSGSSVKKASEMKKVAGQSLRRLTSKNAGEAPNKEVEEDFKVTANSQSLDEVLATPLTQSYLDAQTDAAVLDLTTPKKDNTSEPAAAKSTDAEALLGLSQSKGDETSAPAVHGDAEALLGKSRSNL